MLGAIDAQSQYGSQCAGENPSANNLIDLAGEMRSRMARTAEAELKRNEVP